MTALLTDARGPEPRPSSVNRSTADTSNNPIVILARPVLLDEAITETESINGRGKENAL
ncbi:MAG: hypothetical protein WEA11_03535 [Acidimicrobiales bacterium]